MKILDIQKIILEKKIYSVFQNVVSLTNAETFGFEVYSKLDMNEKNVSIVSVFQKAVKDGSLIDLEKNCRKQALKSAWKQGRFKRLFLNIETLCADKIDFDENYTQKLLEKYSMRPENIYLEISNRFYNMESEKLIQIVTKYKNMGFKISFDDAGSTHSGIKEMCSINPDIIKLDMGLTQNIENDLVKQKMVKSLVSFCKETGIQIVAKGIETPEQLDAVLNLNIDFAQGNYLAQSGVIFPKVSREAFSEIILFQKKKNYSIIKNNTEKNIKENNEKLLNKKKKLITNTESFSKRTIQELCVSGLAVLPDTLAVDVLSFFKEEAEASLATVVSLEGKVLGIIRRAYLLEKFGGRYGYSLNSKKTIQELMNKDFTEIDYSESVDKVALKAVARDEAMIYDPLIITKNQNYLGIVTISNLLDSIVSVEVSDKTKEISRTNKILQEQQIRQKRDLKMAELVQKSFYPQKSVNTDEWESAFVFRPMSNVSGDVYDFYYTPKGSFCGTGLFDVSGHGVASGLVGILSKYIAEKVFREQKDESLDNVLKIFNSVLTKEKGMIENYLTGVFLRVKGNLIEYVNAGHTDVLLKKNDSKKKEVSILGSNIKDFRGSFIGIHGLPEEFKVVTERVEKGDSIILFTDCLIESRNLAGDELGIDLLQKVVKKIESKSAKEILNSIVDSFDAFTEAVPVRDDLTVIVLKYKGE